MKLFVIGATGRTGREVVEQALARGHQVAAFVRSPEGIKLKNERLTVIKGNAMDEDQLANAMQNHDAVVSTLGPREVFKPTSMLHDSAFAITGAMQRWNKTTRCALGGGTFSRYPQSDCQFNHAKSHARFAGHGRSRARQRS